TNDLDGGENVGDQLDLPAGGYEDGAVAITEGDRTPRAPAPSFHILPAEYFQRLGSLVFALYEHRSPIRGGLGSAPLTLRGGDEA
ncbi:MAG: hypothetical protein ACLP8X_29585, partial [Streptosporangiaceae bacterium]